MRAYPYALTHSSPFSAFVIESDFVRFFIFLSTYILLDGYFLPLTLFSHHTWSLTFTPFAV